MPRRVTSLSYSPTLTLRTKPLRAQLLKRSNLNRSSSLLILSVRFRCINLRSRWVMLFLTRYQITVSLSHTQILLHIRLWRKCYMWKENMVERSIKPSCLLKTSCSQPSYHQVPSIVPISATTAK